MNRPVLPLFLVAPALLLASGAASADDTGAPASVGNAAPSGPASVAPPAPASPDPKSPDGSKAATPAATVKVSGLLFAHYGLDLTEGNDLANAFELDRAYLKADGKLTDRISTRLTLDANRMSAATGTDAAGGAVSVPADPRLRLFVKHAWLDFKLADGIDVKGGLVDTPYLPFVESFTDLRWTAKTFLDDQKLESTADLGVTLSGKHSHGLVSWGVGVYNGEFFSNPEVGSGKSVQGRLSVDPLAQEKGKLGLPISVFVDENLREADVAPKLTWAGDVGFKHPNLMVNAEVVGTSQDGVSGLGQSFQVSPRVEDVGMAWVRFDHFDPSADAEDDSNMKILVGAGHEFIEKVDLGVSYERTMLEATPDAPSHGLFVRMQAGF